MTEGIPRPECLFTLVATLALLAPGSAGAVQTDAPVRAEAGDLVAANLSDHSVSLFDGQTGAFLGHLVPSGSGELQNATGVTFGPDGHLYVGSSGNGKILRYDGVTGEFLGEFASGDPMTRPFSLVFGPDGRLYVSDGDRVLRYNADGTFHGIAAQGPELESAIGLTFDREGRLYVVSAGTREVLRFEPEEGRLDRVFAADSLRFPSDLTFGPDGDLFVSSAATFSVVRFDGTTGDFKATVATLPDRGVPVGLVFDARGRLVIGGFSQNILYRIAEDGTLEQVESEGLARPENIAVKN